MGGWFQCRCNLRIARDERQHCLFSHLLWTSDLPSEPGNYLRKKRATCGFSQWGLSLSTGVPVFTAAQGNHDNRICLYFLSPRCFWFHLFSTHQGSQHLASFLIINKSMLIWVCFVRNIEENKNNMGNNDSVNVGVVCSCNWVESFPHTVLLWRVSYSWPAVCT